MTHYSTNLTLRNSVSLAEIDLANAALRVLRAELIYLLSSEFSISVFCSMHSLLAIFLDHIAYVISLLTKKEMARVAAQRVIATVTHAQIIWYFSVNQAPCDAMSQEAAAPKGDQSAPVVELSANPIPASVNFIRLVDLGKKAYQFILRDLRDNKRQFWHFIPTLMTLAAAQFYHKRSR